MSAIKKNTIHADDDDDAYPNMIGDPIEIPAAIHALLATRHVPFTIFINKSA
jgi:hypothetical protein